MWNLLVYVTWPQWRQHRLRTALTAVGIMLGVAVIIAMRLVNHSVFASIRDSVAETAGRATISVANGTAGLPEELLDEVRAIPVVKSAAALILDSGLVVGGANAGERLQVFGVDYLADTEVRSYDLEKESDGSEIEDPIVVLSQPSSIFVTRRFADSHGLKLDSPLRLQVASGPAELVVRGILKESGPAKAYGGMFALMDIFAAQIAFGKGVPGVPGKFDQIDVVLKDGVSFEEGRSAIAAAVGGRGHVDRPESRGEQLEGLLGAMKLGFSQSQALSFIVGMFLIYNTMSIAVVQRRREIGVLRSLGATADEIRALFVVESLALAAIGCAAGVALGWWMARLILPAMESVLATMVTRTTVGYLRLDPMVIATGVAAGFGFALVASSIPARQAGRVSPLVALRRDATTRVELRTIHILGWIGLAGLAASGRQLPADPHRRQLALARDHGMPDRRRRAADAVDGGRDPRPRAPRARRDLRHPGQARRRQPDQRAGAHRGHAHRRDDRHQRLRDRRRAGREPAGDAGKLDRSLHLGGPLDRRVEPPRGSLEQPHPRRGGRGRARRTRRRDGEAVPLRRAPPRGASWRICWRSTWTRTAAAAATRWSRGLPRTTS
ncbi:MAG: ABC transporter permease [Deltaproteobacteria bacterium]|nr:ABC transporter permease [Deltaproteobacteria bacterium]